MGFKNFIMNPKQSLEDMKKSWKEGTFKENYVNKVMAESQTLAKKGLEAAEKGYQLAKEGTQKGVELAKKHTPDTVKQKIESVTDKAMSSIGIKKPAEPAESSQKAEGMTKPEGTAKSEGTTKSEGATKTAGATTSLNKENTPPNKETDNTPTP